MKTYSVTMPLVGSITVVVEAENEQAAKEAALLVDFDVDNVDELETMEKICEGNVLYAPCSEITVQEK
jgi:hypothetical protein